MNMIAAEVTVEGGKAYLTAQGEGVRSTQNCRDQDLDAAEVTAAWKNQLGEDDAWTGVRLHARRLPRRRQARRR
jgi:hypothetical protein